MITFSLQVAQYTYPGVADAGIFDHLVACVQAAEDAGFQDVLTVDHFYQVGVNGPPEHAMLESYLTLGALAAKTKRVNLGTLVTGVTYRNPAHLAKIVTTLDVISGGRALLGIGAAWNDEEHRAYGFDFPPLAERFDRLEEAIAICKLMFTDERVTYTGVHSQVKEALNFPRPVQAAGPRILIGGSGETRTLPLVARYANVSNLFGGSVDEIRHKLDVLRHHCEVERRPYDEIAKTVGVGVVIEPTMSRAKETVDVIVRERVAGSRRMNLPRSEESVRASIIAGTPQSVADELAPYVEAGITGFSISNFFLPTPAAFDHAAKLIEIMNR